MPKFSTLRARYQNRILQVASSDFETRLLTAAFDNLENAGPLRFNNFSYVVREFLRHFLHASAPNEEIKNCSWFKPDSSASDGITRTHRAKYVIQGGLTDWFVKNKLGIDISASLKKLASAQNVLNKHTHIEPKTFGTPDKIVKSLANEFLASVDIYIKQITECRHLVRDALAGDLDSHLVNKAVSDGLDEIGEIATHGWLNDFSVDDVLVTNISSRNVILSVNGSVDVGLQYGSNSDVRNDIGFVTSDSFPFSATIIVKIEKPLGKFAVVEELNVDTDSFYE